MVCLRVVEVLLRVLCVHRARSQVGSPIWNQYVPDALLCFNLYRQFFPQDQEFPKNFPRWNIGTLRSTVTQAAGGLQVSMWEWGLWSAGVALAGCGFVGGEREGFL